MSVFEDPLIVLEENGFFPKTKIQDGFAKQSLKKRLEEVECIDGIKTNIEAASVRKYCEPVDDLRLVDVISPILGVTFWRWPVYEIWRDQFAESGIYPKFWHMLSLGGQEEIPPYKSAVRREQWITHKRIELLAHYLHMGLMNDVHHVRNQDAFELGIAARWDVQRSDCPVEDDFAKRFNSGKINSFPPFFPGDRSSLGVKLKE